MLRYDFAKGRTLRERSALRGRIPQSIPLMAYDTIEVYVRGLSTEGAVDWLQDVLGPLKQVREEPAATYEGKYSDAAVPVQVAEQVQGGLFTSLWFNAPDLPWDTTADCARAVHEATGKEVLCYPDQAEEPWTLLRVADGAESYVDERELDTL